MRGALAAGDRARRLIGLASGRDGQADQSRETINELEELVGNIVRDLNKYGARALGIRSIEGSPYSEPAEFLNSVLTCGGTAKDAPAAHGAFEFRWHIEAAFLQADHASARAG